MIADLFADLRYSLRTLQRTPLFATATITALTLGLGANTAIFSVVNTVLLTRLPYFDADRIVVLTTQTPAGAYGGASMTKLNLWKEQGGVFEDVSAYRFRFANVKAGARGLPARPSGIPTYGYPLKSISPAQIRRTRLWPSLACARERRSARANRSSNW